MTHPYTWPPRPQPPRPTQRWARKRYVLPALSFAFFLVYLLGFVAGASGDDGTTDDAEPAAASPGPTVTVTAAATAKTKPAPTVTVTKTVEVTVTAQPAAGSGNDSGSSGTSGESSSGGEPGIQFGYACSPVGTLGTAEDGRPAKCFMGKDGRARWGYDSSRG
ncbi:hypothetical protein [Streptomyces flaveus]|uniref:Uncharacterized protein n=1 Tax=Streptomyces flaveus TaxID=66370 RepID=A0A917VNN3_9ACTN|nr:hypothetical protein [Streptomyces flaveus]GGL03326.1 hypothetical protein GCM10010094_75180 [Streptomyces flaveus]